MYNSFMYTIFNDGLDSEAAYKYKGMVSHNIFLKKQLANRQLLNTTINNAPIANFGLCMILLHIGCFIFNFV